MVFRREIKGYNENLEWWDVFALDSKAQVISRGWFASGQEVSEVWKRLIVNVKTREPITKFQRKKNLAEIEKLQYKNMKLKIENEI